MSAPRRRVRYEIKYRVDHHMLEAFHARIRAMMIPDPFSADGRGYGNYSIYFDSPGLRNNVEKEEGLSFRTKPRLRIYRRLDDFAPVAYFLELKHRQDASVTKERIPIDRDLAQRLLDPLGFANGHEATDTPILAKFRYITRRYDLRPMICVLYRRQAFTDSLFSGLRITYDRRISASVQVGLDTPPDRFYSVLPPHETVVEIKYDERRPNWLNRIVQELEMRQVSLSKYVVAMASASQHRWQIGGMEWRRKNNGIR